MKARGDDSKQIDDALRAATEELVSYFRGLPNKALSGRNEMRWGKCGSLAAVINGRNTGKITDYEGGPGKSYSPLGFIAAELRCDMAGAFKFARDWLNLSDDRPAPTAKQVIKSPEPVPAADAASRRKASRLRNILASLRDLSGTPGELYLRNRGIHIDQFPDAVRWMTPTWGGLLDGAPQRGGALVVIATDAAGKPQAAQVIHLTDDGLKAPKDLVGGVVKRTAGTLAGAAVRLPGTGSVVLAEGPETGLSIWAATGREVWICLGVSNFAKQIMPPGSTVVIARDHDKPGCPADKQVTKAATTLTEAGHTVRIACPPIVGDDFNDVVKRDGAEAVRALIDAAVEFIPAPETVAAISPGPDPDAPSVEAVRAGVAEALSRFSLAVVAHREATIRFEKDAYDRAAGLRAEYFAAHNLAGLFPPIVPQIGLAAVTGIGKSTLVREQVIRALRAAASDRPVVMLCPTLGLCEEAAESARAGGLRAAVIRGRTADRPGAPDPLPKGDPGQMCIDPSAPEDALHSVEGVQRTVCFRHDGKRGDLFCERFDECPYQIQRDEATNADVVFMAHNHLFNDVPEFLGIVSAVVVDESFWQTGLNNSRSNILCSDLRCTRDVRLPNGKVDLAVSADLNDANARLARALAACTGPLTAAALWDAGVTTDIAAGAHRLMWRCKMNSEIYPGIPATERNNRRFNVEKNNKAVALHAKAWEVVRDLLICGDDNTAWLDCTLINTPNGKTPGATLRFRRNIASGWTVPTLVIDATLRDELVRPYLPFLCIEALPYPATPFAKIRQILGAPVTMHKLSEAEGRRDKDKKTAQNHMTDLMKYIKIKAAQNKTCLVICQLDVEEKLKKMGLPSNFEIAHFNATRGIDRWKNVGYCLVIGRTLPGPQAPESLSETLTGRPSDRVEGWYPSHDGGSEYHPDPVAEACRWAICEAEIVQNVGRPRGINRTAGNPVLIEIMNDTVLPVPVDETVRWGAPTRIDEMVGRGVFLENNRDKALCFPDIWDNEDASRKDVQRSGTNAYKDTPLKAFVPLLSCTYRPAGPGQKNRTARFNLSAIPDPRKWLEAHLGPLALFEIASPVANSSSNETAIQAGMSALIGEPATHLALGRDPATAPAPQPTTVKQAQIKMKDGVVMNLPTDHFYLRAVMINNTTGERSLAWRSGARPADPGDTADADEGVSPAAWGLKPVGQGGVAVPLGLEVGGRSIYRIDGKARLGEVVPFPRHAATPISPTPVVRDYLLGAPGTPYVAPAPEAQPAGRYEIVERRCQGGAIRRIMVFSPAIVHFDIPLITPQPNTPPTDPGIRAVVGAVRPAMQTAASGPSYDQILEQVTGGSFADDEDRAEAMRRWHAAELPAQAMRAALGAGR